MGDGVVRDRSVYEFNEVRVDLARMAALRGDGAIPLEPKAFDVLVYLIEHRDRVVTKDELLDAVWTGTFVTPNVLSRAVAQIRKALGDESQDARYIETVAKRGIGSSRRSRSSRRWRTRRRPWPLRQAASTRLRLLRAGIQTGRVVAPGRLWSFLRCSRSPCWRWSWWSTGSKWSTSSEPHIPIAADVQLKRLTNRRGFTGTPAVAPDGHAVVYSSDATGSLELYLVNLVQGSAEVALTKDGGHNVQPSWSPDGQWIAFHSRRRGGVWIVPSSGGAPQQVADFGSDPAWAPDSRTIVFTSDAGGLAAQSSLWTVSRDGTDRRALTRVGTPAGGHRAPVWSHDGRHVAFIVSRGAWKTDVWIVDVASGPPHLVGGSDNAADPCFAPGDRAILWGGSTATGNGRLFRQAIDADGNPTGAAETVLPMDAGIVDGLSIAADGTIAFSARTSDANLWATDIKPDGRGGEPVRLTDDVSRNTRADYSSDGRIAYIQTAIGLPTSVWLMREDGSARAPLLSGTGGADPQFDRTAPRLLMSRMSGASGWEFVWVDLASRRMTPAALLVKDVMSPRLSPDAAAIAFHRIETDGRMTVWTEGFDGTEKKIATDPEAVSYPAWSPDGKSLAVEIKRGDSTHIGVVPRNGRARRAAHRRARPELAALLGAR